MTARLRPTALALILPLASRQINCLASREAEMMIFGDTHTETRRCNARFGVRSAYT